MKKGKTAGLTVIFSFLICSFLAACGVQVGTQPYVTEQNVGPQSRRYQTYLPPNLRAPNKYTEASLDIYDVSSVVYTIRNQIGVPYRYGGSEPRRGFDCSGLIYWAYQQHGIVVPRLAKLQSTYGRSVSRNNLEPGDIVAFKVNGTFHTGIYTGNGSFIHSPRKGQRVREESMNTPYWRRAYVGARRVY